MINMACSFFILAALLLHPSAVAPTVLEQCTGCVGTTIPAAGADAASGGLCGDVAIYVDIDGGACWRVDGNCVIQRDCTAHVYRSWTDTTGHTNGCVQYGSARYCIEPPLAPTGGSGDDYRTYGLECGVVPLTWTTRAACASAQNGWLTASVTGVCTSCTEQ